MSSKFTQLINKRFFIIVILFFTAILILGLFIYKDYGISWDEHLSRTKGFVSLDYVLTGDTELFTSPGRYYGPAFDMLLAAVEKYFGIGDRAIFFIRHLVNFLLFYISSIFFFLIIKRIFKSWKLGLLGAFFLILSPRIFAHAFFNPKDLPFMSMFIICMYTLFLFLEKKTFLMALLHGLSTALLIDIRILGIIVPLTTSIFFILDLIIKKDISSKGKKIIVVGLVYLAAATLLTILFWPLLWGDPINRFIEAFKQMSNYPWDGYNLYLGKFIRATDVPWHYIPVWIIITTPLIYIAGFLFGCFKILKEFFNNPLEHYRKRTNDLILLVWFFLPIFIVIILQSVLYNGWRQMYFIYPALLLIAIRGIDYIFNILKQKNRGFLLRAILIIFITLGLLYPSYFMVRYHPYQNLYFNVLAGRGMQDAKENFEIDYWGLTFREGLEYILENDDREVIKISYGDAPGRRNSRIIKPADRGRIDYVDHPMYADYFIANYKYHRTDYLYEEEFYSISIGNAKVLVIYKLN